MAFDVTIKEYLKEIDASQLLTWEQEKDLANRVRDFQDPEAREHLVKSNLRLVVNIAKKFSGTALTLGDLIEEGNLGLLRAVDTFDPDHGVRFSTYSAWWIKQAIKKSILSNAQPIHIPTYMVELINHWRYAVAELESQLGKSPELPQIAEAMKLSMRKAKAIQHIVDIVNAGFQGDSLSESNGIDDSIEDGQAASPEDVLGNDEEIAKAVELLGEIEPRQAQVLALRFGIDGGEPLTLKQIGLELNLTRERVRQIQRGALQRLNELMTA